MKKVLFLVVLMAASPVFAVRTGGGQPAGTPVPGGARGAGSGIARGARDGAAVASRTGRSAPAEGSAASRGNGNIARENRAATLGNVVGVHEGLKRVYRKYCGSLPAIAAAATKDGYCSEETFNVSEEEIFAPAAPPASDAPAREEAQRAE